MLLCLWLCYRPHLSIIHCWKFESAPRKNHGPPSLLVLIHLRVAHQLVAPQAVGNSHGAASKNCWGGGVDEISAGNLLPDVPCLQNAMSSSVGSGKDSDQGKLPAIQRKVAKNVQHFVWPHIFLVILSKVPAITALHQVLVNSVDQMSVTEVYAACWIEKQYSSIVIYPPAASCEDDSEFAETCPKSSLISVVRGSSSVAINRDYLKHLFGRFFLKFGALDLEKLSGVKRWSTVERGHLVGDKSQ
ncbi:hypothetical protein B0H14DRAFT_3747130 [Mycena olivaceomarginata]|nr:hypothetical protein B0H14DRAFT_3747130 [Mycena olivaceomarginata]